jgi:protein TonB
VLAAPSAPAAVAVETPESIAPRPIAPTPPPPPEKPLEPTIAPQPAIKPAAPAPRKIVTARPKEQKNTPAPAPEPAIKTPPPITPKRRISAAQLLASRNEEIAHFTTELDRISSAYAKHPRRKAISASTKEHKYAAYLDAWRRKVERIGNLNYPDEARRKKLFGNLILHVAVKADGSVQHIRVLHSSGHKVLDDAAVRIVSLSSPFAPFPPDILREVDVLDITRTWQFLNNNRLGWK